MKTKTKNILIEEKPVNSLEEDNLLEIEDLNSPDLKSNDSKSGDLKSDDSKSGDLKSDDSESKKKRN